MARVCVIRQGHFPLDPRVSREVRALALAGHEIDVVCLARPGERFASREEGVRVFRIPLGRGRGGKVKYLLEYGAFFIAATLLVSLLHPRRRFRLVQVHSLPDPLVFAAFLPKLTGARVLLDLHETMPEFFATKFRTALESRPVKAIAALEQASIRFADHTITCTEQMREAFVGRGARREDITVVVNSSDETVFDPERYPPQPRQADRFVLICHGSIEERYGLDTAVRAIALLKDEIPGLTLEIYGEGTYLPKLRQLVHELGIAAHVRFSHGFVPMPELLEAIARADAGLVAMKRDPFRDLTQCNKMYDLMAMRRPSIVSRTRSVEESFAETCFLLFESDDEQDLAGAIRKLYGDPALGERLVEEATRALEPLRWARQRAVYQAVVEGLLATGSREAAATTASRPSP